MEEALRAIDTGDTDTGMIIRLNEKVLTIRDVPREGDAFEYLLKNSALVNYWDGSLLNKQKETADERR